MLDVKNNKRVKPLEVNLLLRFCCVASEGVHKCSLSRSKYNRRTWHRFMGFTNQCITPHGEVYRGSITGSKFDLLH